LRARGKGKEGNESNLLAGESGPRSILPIFRISFWREGKEKWAGASTIPEVKALSEKSCFGESAQNPKGGGERGREEALLDQDSYLLGNDFYQKKRGTFLLLFRPTK